MDSPYSLIDKYDNRIGDWYYSITFINEFTCKAIKDNGIRASTEYSINLITGDVNKGNDIDRSSVNEDQNDIAKMKAELTSSNNFELSIENKVSEPIAELSNTQIKTTQTPNKSFEDKEVQKETGFFRKIIDLITK